MSLSLPNISARLQAEPVLWDWEYGKVLDESIDRYHECPAISKTKLGVFIQSPKLFWKTFVAKTIPKEEPSEALIIGQAVDTLSLEGPEEFARRFSVVDASAPKRPTAAQLAIVAVGQLDSKGKPKKPSEAAMRSVSFWADWNEANKGKMPLDAGQEELVKRCADALHSNDDFAKLMAGGTSQVTFRVKGEHVSLQCRPDRWCEEGGELTDGMPAILDVKTIQELPADDFDPAMEDHLPRHIAKFGYHLGSFLYPEIVANVMKYQDGFRPKFILCFVEKTEPFAVTCRPMDDTAIDVGERVCRDAIHKLVRCVQTNEWPEKWCKQLATVGLPPYFVRKALEGTDPHLFG